MTFDAVKTPLSIIAVFGPIILSFYLEEAANRKRRRERERKLQQIHTQRTNKPAAAKHKKSRNKPQQPVKQPANPPKNIPSPDTLKALHTLADAERGIAETLERKMQYTPDPVKRARLEKQAANSWYRFNSILDKIDKAESSD